MQPTDGCSAGSVEDLNQRVDLVRSYESYAIERVVIAPGSNARHGADAMLRRLDEFAELAGTA